MNLPLFHDPLAGTVTLDASLRDPEAGREGAFRRDMPTRDFAPRRKVSTPRTMDHGSAPTRSARQRKVADDLQTLMALRANKY